MRRQFLIEWQTYQIAKGAGAYEDDRIEGGDMSYRSGITNAWKTDAAARECSTRRVSGALRWSVLGGVWGCLLLTLLPLRPAHGEATLGYYRFPSIYKDTVVFTAEGDLWRVAAEGGLAQRLTSHPAQETHAAISPDG